MQTNADPARASDVNHKKEADRANRERNTMIPYNCAAQICIERQRTRHHLDQDAHKPHINEFKFKYLSIQLQTADQPNRPLHLFHPELEHGYKMLL